MTPQQKAKQLVERFEHAFEDAGAFAADLPKRFALIAAEVACEAVGSMEDPTMFIEGIWTHAQDWWVAVKEEIDKL